MPPRNPATRPPVDRAAIATAARDLITEAGTAGVTMRNLATRLGVSAMALYHHVEDKDEVMRLVGDDLLGHLELPDPDSGDWRDLLTMVVNRSYDALQSVPGVSAVLLSSKLLPNARSLLLFSLHQLERAGLDRDAAMEAYAGVHQLFLGRLLVADSANFQLNSATHADDDVRGYIAVLHRRSSFDRALAALLDHYALGRHEREHTE